MSSLFSFATGILLNEGYRQTPCNRSQFAPLSAHSR